MKETLIKGFVAKLEEGKTSWAAEFPELPGLFVVARTPQAVVRSARQAIPFHVRTMLETGELVEDSVLVRALGSTLEKVRAPEQMRQIAGVLRLMLKESLQKANA